MSKAIHIIALDVPYPANYGGAIDSYYLIKNLHALQYKITLHCFTYKDRIVQEHLNTLCTKVIYYNRGNYLKYLFSNLPIIVASRNNPLLLQHLLLDTSPILSLGLNGTGFFSNPLLQGRLKLARTFNVESNYYKALAVKEKNWFKKLYFTIEGNRLLRYEQQLTALDYLLCITPQDNAYFKQQLQHKAVHIDAFHAMDAVEINVENHTEKYCLYNGNLTVPENIEAALWLLKNVAPQLPNTKIIIAGASPSSALIQAAGALQNVQIIPNPSQPQMQQLIADAHIHLLPTFVNTGIKLKLVNALYSGKHIIVNDAMLNNLPITTMVHLANTGKDWITNINKLWETTFTQQDIAKRKAGLSAFLNNKNSALQLDKLIQSIFLI